MSVFGKAVRRAELMEDRIGDTERLFYDRNVDSYTMVIEFEASGSRCSIFTNGERVFLNIFVRSEEVNPEIKLYKEIYLRNLREETNRAMMIEVVEPGFKKMIVTFERKGKDWTVSEIKRNTKLFVEQILRKK